MPWDALLLRAKRPSNQTVCLQPRVHCAAALLGVQGVLARPRSARGALAGQGLSTRGRSRGTAVFCARAGGRNLGRAELGTQGRLDGVQHAVDRCVVDVAVERDVLAERLPGFIAAAGGPGVLPAALVAGDVVEHAGLLALNDGALFGGLDRLFALPDALLQLGDAIVPTAAWPRRGPRWRRGTISPTGIRCRRAP